MSSPLVHSHSFNEPSADVVFVSSDDVVFKLHKVILSLGSDFFKDMFSLSQPSLLAPSDPQMNASAADMDVDGLPVIRVSEPGEVLNKIFRLCYPLDDPHLVTIDEVAAILTAALKYDLRKPIQMASRRLRELMPTASLRVYAIACRLDLKDEARAAAMVIRKDKLQDEYVAELEDISIGAYHRLLYYCATGTDPSGLSFTHRPTKKATPGKKKTKQLKSTSVSRHSSPPAVIRPPPPTFAGYPFNIVDPELTIQTSNGVAFGLSRSFIQLTSPVLSGMGPDRSTPSTIQVPESSEIVDIIFRICSPVENPSVTDIHVIDSALIAATKYQMKKAVQFLQVALVKQADVSSTDPFLLYTIACRHDMRSLAMTAAKRTLRTELRNTLRPEVEAIDISAGYLYRLHDYHRRCREAIQKVFASDSWIETDQRARFVALCRRLYCNQNLPCWYSRYMAEVGRDSWPGPLSAVKEAALRAAFATSHTNCSYCIQNDGAVQLIKFTEYLAETLARLENEVTLEWPSGPNPSSST